MAIERNYDGTFRFNYHLKVVPCKFCRSTEIDLYESGGQTHPDEHKKGPTEGGGICKFCGHTVHVGGIPTVPSMTMLLEIWNQHNEVILGEL